MRGSQRPSVSNLVASQATRAGVVTKVACSKVKGGKSGGEEELWKEAGECILDAHEKEQSNEE